MTKSKLNSVNMSQAMCYLDILDKLPTRGAITLKELEHRLSCNMSRSSLGRYLHALEMRQEETGVFSVKGEENSLLWSKRDIDNKLVVSSQEAVLLSLAEELTRNQLHPMMWHSLQSIFRKARATLGDSDDGVRPEERRQWVDCFCEDKFSCHEKDYLDSFREVLMALHAGVWLRVEPHSWGIFQEEMQPLPERRFAPMCFLQTQSGLNVIGQFDGEPGFSIVDLSFHPFKKTEEVFTLPLKEKLDAFVDLYNHNQYGFVHLECYVTDSRWVEILERDREYYPEATSEMVRKGLWRINIPNCLSKDYLVLSLQVLNGEGVEIVKCERVTRK